MEIETQFNQLPKEMEKKSIDYNAVKDLVLMLISNVTNTDNDWLQDALKDTMQDEDYAQDKQLLSINETIDNLKIKRFWGSYQRNIKILINCTNHAYVNKTDKKTLVEDSSPLERNHLRYLLMKDDLILQLVNNSSHIEVFLHPMLYAFGLFQHSIDQIKDLEEDILRFRSTEKEAVFSLYIGAVNHWINLIIHKPPGAFQTPQFYLLDSSNLKFLDKVEEQLIEVQEKRCRRKASIGLKPSSQFMVKMSIHSLFDQRRIYEILVDVFNGKSSIAQYYCSSFTNNILKQFHMFTDSLQTEPSNLSVPKSRMFAQSKPLSEDEEKSLAKYDLSEFLYPFKQVEGDYKYLKKLSSKEDLLNFFDLIQTFLSSCQRPQHIEADINRNVHSFGIEGFFKNDIGKLTNWTQALLDADEKIKKVVGQGELLSQKGAQNVRLFEQLIAVVRQLNSKLQKPSLLQKFRNCLS
ncbi:UNKNOWN [Stylonychia lemnae]|uniref:Uncharacterized protein n=1 Tax=Stylonychia lemnae TaxID=5949 RepID=A0A077ZTE1_STYLE|nr:UNKNOWN [Stylonychia lemnae]|eukprot:CDW73152.1 UNKNOWN [Stylonychia lemnae]